jgi:hypothetical protein
LPPIAAQDQEDLLGEIFDIVRIDAEAPERPHQIVQLALVCVQAGFVYRVARHGSRARLA